MPDFVNAEREKLLTNSFYECSIALITRAIWSNSEKEFYKSSEFNFVTKI